MKNKCRTSYFKRNLLWWDKPSPREADWTPYINEPQPKKMDYDKWAKEPPEFLRFVKCVIPVGQHINQPKENEE
jgi:hypothetical protein